MRTKTRINIIATLFLLIFSLGIMPATQPAAQAATIVRVKPDGSTSGGCGSTWGTACELRTALTAASPGTEIWVAAGTYKPGTNREDTFQMKSGVGLYGGFTGTETAREQRDWESNLTVLSGDIGVPDNSSDNSYHVVTGSEVDATAILDGFTVSGGNSALYGGGMYNYHSSPSVTNVIISDNFAAYGGAGMRNEFFSNPFMTNVIFRKNDAGMGWGGGVSNSGGNPVFANVIFSGNKAYSGAGMYNGGSNPVLTNVILIRNSAGNIGGGIYNSNSNPVLTNVTGSDNQADNFGGGMYNINGSNPTIINSILWGNTVKFQAGPQIFNEDESKPIILYSDIQGGCAAISGNDCSGGGNIDYDPLFARTPDPGFDGIWGTADDDFGDFRQKSGSPVIDAGDNTAPGLVGVTTDLGGNPRFYNVPGVPDTGVGPAPVIDMGAYEKHSNDAPRAGNDFYNTEEDITLHINLPGVLVNDGDPDDDLLIPVLEDQPSKGSLDFNADGSFEYVPELLYNGEVTFTYRTFDGMLYSNLATVTISVEHVNKAPIAYDDTYNTFENTSITINTPGVLENDSDLDGDPLSAMLVSGPSSGILTLNPDGSFDFLPEVDYEGLVTFTYRATDGLLESNTATVTITIIKTGSELYLPMLIR